MICFVLFCFDHTFLCMDSVFWLRNVEIGTDFSLLFFLGPREMRGRKYFWFVCESKLFSLLSFAFRFLYNKYTINIQSISYSSTRFTFSLWNFIRRSTIGFSAYLLLSFLFDEEIFGLNEKSFSLQTPN